MLPRFASYSSGDEFFTKLIQCPGRFENWRAGFSGVVMAVYLRDTLVVKRTESGFARICVADVGQTKTAAREARLWLSILS
jgi:hypothetical protein